MFINRKVRKYGVTEGPGTQYEVQLRFDGNTAEGKAFRKAVEAINPNIVGTKHVEKDGQFTVRATTQFQPKVLDAAGEELQAEDIPGFPQGSTGTAAITVKEFKGKMGSGIKLIGIGLSELNLSEAAQKSSSSLDALRASILNG